MLREKPKRPKPQGKSTDAENWDGPTRRSNEGSVMVATRTSNRGKRALGTARKMGEGLPGSACRSRPQTTSVLLHSKGVVVSDRGKGAIKASGAS